MASGSRIAMGYVESDSDDSLPAGWEERAGGDGKVYYVDHAHRRTQWAHPRTGRHKVVPANVSAAGDGPQFLPNDWSATKDSAGRQLFTNSTTGATTYTDPRLVSAAECTSAGGAQVATLRQKHDASTYGPAVLHGVELNGTVVAMTGATSGAGLHAARALVRHGARLVVFARFNRSCDARRRFMCELEAKHEHLPAPHTAQAPSQADSVRLIDCDLSSLRSVHAAVEQFEALSWPLNTLLLNAAVACLPHSTTVDGLEATFQVNCFAQYYLFRLLKDKLLAGRPSRVIFTSAESHRFLLEDIKTPRQITRDLFTPTEKEYWHWTAYNLSRLSNIWLAGAANRRYCTQGIHVNSVHLQNLPLPGDVQCRSWFYWLLAAALRPWTKSASQAAATLLYAAASSDTKGVGGHYFCNCWLAQPSRTAADPQLQDAFWTLCAHWFGHYHRIFEPSQSGT